MEEFDIATIINKNYTFFKEEILPYYIIINTLIGSIVINVEEYNLKHLLGINKTANTKFKNMAAKKLFAYLENRDINLFEIIDEQRYIDNELTTEEFHILRKNYSFIHIFKSLFNEPCINFYKKKMGDNFDADYVQFTFVDKSGGYIGIIGSTQSDYHYFNSVMLENDIPEKYKGNKMIVKDIIKVKKEYFNFNEYIFVKSNRFNRETTINSVAKVIKKKPTDITVLKKNKRTLLNNDLRIEIGKYGKNTIQLYRNRKIIEERMVIPEEYKYEKIEVIAKYINENYQ